MDDRGRSLLLTNLRPNMINTMKVFFSVGEEVDEAASEEAIRDVFTWENWDSETIRGSIDSSPSQWLLGDIIPAIEPFLLPEDFWTKCAITCLSCVAFNPSLIDVLRNGGISLVRSIVGDFIYRLTYEDPSKSDTTGISKLWRSIRVDCASYMNTWVNFVHPCHMP